VPHLPSPQEEFGLAKGILLALVILITVHITPRFATLAWGTRRSLSCPLVLHTDCQQQIKLSVHRHSAVDWCNKQRISKNWDLLAFYLKEEAIFQHSLHDIWCHVDKRWERIVAKLGLLKVVKCYLCPCTLTWRG